MFKGGKTHEFLAISTIESWVGWNEMCVCDLIRPRGECTNGAERFIIQQAAPSDDNCFKSRGLARE
jgi:hypothetical protein